MCCPSQVSRVEHLAVSVIFWRLVPFFPSGRQGVGTLDEGDGAKAEARPEGQPGTGKERPRGRWGQAGTRARHEGRL